MVRGHLSNLTRQYPNDAVLTQAASSILSFGDHPGPFIGLALLQVVTYAENECPAVAQLVLDQLQPPINTAQRCTRTAALIETLRTVRNQTDRSSALTTKDHLVETFNGLLDEAKRIYTDDDFVREFGHVRIQMWHADTKRQLLAAIDSLSSRVQTYAAACTTTDATTTGASQE